MRERLMSSPWDRAILSAETEVDWEERVFLNLSNDLHAKLGLPEWKLYETTRNLKRIFAFSVAEGKSFDVALETVNQIFREILSINGIIE